MWMCYRKWKIDWVERNLWVWFWWFRGRIFNGGIIWRRWCVWFCLMMWFFVWWVWLFFVIGMCFCFGNEFVGFCLCLCDYELVCEFFGWCLGFYKCLFFFWSLYCSMYGSFYFWWIGGLCCCCSGVNVGSFLLGSMWFGIVGIWSVWVVEWWY